LLFFLRHLRLPVITEALLHIQLIATSLLSNPFFQCLLFFHFLFDRKLM
jgi:hypothetical protein